MFLFNHIKSRCVAAIFIIFSVHGAYLSLVLNLHNTLLFLSIINYLNINCAVLLLLSHPELQGSDLQVRTFFIQNTINYYNNILSCQYASLILLVSTIYIKLFGLL